MMKNKSMNSANSSRKRWGSDYVKSSFPYEEREFQEIQILERQSNNVGLKSKRQKRHTIFESLSLSDVDEDDYQDVLKQRHISRSRVFKSSVSLDEFILHNHNLIFTENTNVIMKVRSTKSQSSGIFNMKKNI